MQSLIQEIQLYLEVKRFLSLKKKVSDPIEITIGGIFSAGKTSLSFNLSQYLKIKQRASLGVISKTLMYLRPKDKLRRKLDTVDQDTKSFPHFMKQSKEMCGIVKLILDISRADGVDYILDGVQLLPQYLNLTEQSFYIFIKTPTNLQYKHNLNNSSTHPKRYKHVSVDQINKLKTLEEFLLSSIESKPNIKIIDFIQGEKALTIEVVKRINTWLERLVK